MNLLKWDGHTHTQFCPHGNRDSVSSMVEKAIEFGFTHYSITEHAPLPFGLMKNQTLQDELVISEPDLEDYFKECSRVKAFYKNKIQVLTALEVDYLDGHEDYTRSLLERFGPNLDDALLSLHLMEGKDGIRALDYSPEDFKDAFIDVYGSLHSVYLKYWATIFNMIQSDLGPFKPSRIGHINLIRKFQSEFPYNEAADQKLTGYISDVIFPAIASKGMCLDYNVAGLSKATCGEVYVNSFLIDLCKRHKIGLVYGSDAHGTKAIGHFYDHYLNMRSKTNIMPPTESI